MESVSLSSTRNPSISRRENLLSEVRHLIAGRRREYDRRRARFFQPDFTSAANYEASLGPFRERLATILGWPLGEPLAAVSDAWTEWLSENDDGRVARVQIPVIGNLRAYGLLFLPPSPGRYPLILTQHGGLGSPELAAGLQPEGSANYNAIVTGLRRHPVAVFAPQLLVWHNGLEPKFDQNELDRSLRQLGGSRAAVDLCMLKASLNWLLTHPEIDAARVGMTGLSYGGFYSLYFGALEPRIRVLVSSCFVNDRYRINREDMVWTDVAREFLDAEVGGLLCPRPLFIEAGEKDDVFPVESFRNEARRIAQIYDRLGMAGNFVFRTHLGGHEYDPDSAAENFLLDHLGITSTENKSPSNKGTCSSAQ